MFKNSSGKYFTKSLFLEQSYDDPTHAIYTTKDQDHELNGKIYKSFKKKYIELADPTEYRQSQELTDGWQHWKALIKCKALQDFIEECREELEVAIVSGAVKEIAYDAISGSRSAVGSAKWLADKGWKEQQKRKAGRPTKEEVQRELKFATKVDKEIQEDMERMGLVN